MKALITRMENFSDEGNLRKSVHFYKLKEDGSVEHLRICYEKAAIG
jgi:hypothetical protein